ncbi:pantoate--beta-alanine ligase [Aquicella lusitana]|uniref:Pantothenate synthetase n=1 Tax=Aquicella lusitana TaxID=254246 RepID=A0A370H222_9COXI|nr:pantoate--beta-alanine ligase [Aquicella lusitana]RDI48103.1 pantothenate synthetase [Aquicella lusitana]VVC72881.1 Pantothenate synthetase [Aquicella lusitana]
MNIVSKIDAWQAIRKACAGKTIGFVPTMGHLHAGHLSLCERSRRENEITVVSIFVNPTQFNQASDFDLYPRTLEQDTAILASQQVDYLLLPDAESLYPDHYQIQLTETEMSRELEGEYRPGHFNGMLTVVLKLLNLVQPARAYFGEKDYQQLLLVKKMAAALFLPVDIVPCETIRAEDGLALSSRNSRLNTEQRQKAAHFPQLLQSHQPVEHIAEQLKALGFKVDYIVEKWQRRLGAVWLDDVRLIDNISIHK